MTKLKTNNLRQIRINSNFDLLFCVVSAKFLAATCELVRRAKAMERPSITNILEPIFAFNFVLYGMKCKS